MKAFFTIVWLYRDLMTPQYFDGFLSDFKVSYLFWVGVFNYFIGLRLIFNGFYPLLTDNAFSRLLFLFPIS
jgi:hypothetical protein